MHILTVTATGLVFTTRTPEGVLITSALIGFWQ